MDLYILDHDRDCIGIIDDAESVIWTPKYDMAGDFEVYAYASTKNLSLLQSGNYVSRLDDDMVGVIDKIVLTTDEDAGDHITATGKDLSGLLGRRIVWNQTILTGTVEAAIRQLVTENVISPTKTTRAIPKFILGELNNFTEKIEKQVTGDNLLNAIVEICQSFEYGFKVTMDSNKNFVFNLYKGTDRSDQQSDVPRVNFSPEFDNITASEYVWDETTYKNVALVAGEGEGTARKTMAVGDSSGLSRYEMYVDARNLSTNKGEITETEYMSQLRQKGLETLSENGKFETFVGEIIPGFTYHYKLDYFLGDVVTVTNEFGIKAAARIVAIIECEDATGHKTVPTFEHWRVIEE